MAKIENYNFFINQLRELGFVFPSSQIYGGLANSYDYGHLGVLLRKNIENFWADFFVNSNPNAFFIDSKILLNPKVWQASGHLDNFVDLLVENKINKKRYRVDHLFEEFFPEVAFEKLSQDEIRGYLSQIQLLENAKVEWASPKKFNLLFPTYQGIIEDEKTLLYLRPETAQGIFINFKNLLRTTKNSLPLIIAQVGKSFRNEISPGNFIFRTREFVQLELEIFLKPDQSENFFQNEIEKIKNFLKKLGFAKNSIRLNYHKKEKLAHYAKATVDFEYNFNFGWGELIGISNRGDYDLKNHSEKSGEKLEFVDSATGKKFLPHIIEPSMGLDRLMLAVLEECFCFDSVKNRYFLKLPFILSPYKVAVLPLLKKFNFLAEKIWNELISQKISATLVTSGSIGKRYYHQDVIGTYFCITIDQKSVENSIVTLRFRDTTEQKTLKIDEITKFIKENFVNE
ncbi:glycine--tRNA ligase [Mesomycoplasma hyopneumoniae]|uniref:glycine--tRNA ligase n=1 Tax=Mesomycoplasma hyopneumoniae TaxID=2099 RepID=UPI001082C2C4|nr:glycine--tRNA ligase [Mesomycoplasma hyopneumoniae]MXR09890.1 glycine--tRNA ligase [Mesomycoplasma hyopneumoniae]MXR10785.1 glycine--tRNA ligase [Mesomycoplasma hyopneumoniae]MXR34148.1 glycine--tRNA ligase [Mesomycoplasma hyopneumoniae]MXR34786.1 glycine--tRNA ligase [Mesomycoplasma hyopneumoniae]MXR44459.1 glycine--tRNA ligase [Mesomycoplasma hyopneumoniae]